MNYLHDCFFFVPCTSAYSWRQFHGLLWSSITDNSFSGRLEMSDKAHLPAKRRASYHTYLRSLSSGIVCSHSLASYVSLPHSLVITPPSSGASRARCFITRCTLDSTHPWGTLDSTPPYKSTPGCDIFKGENVITGVCF